MEAKGLPELPSVTRSPVSTRRSMGAGTRDAGAWSGAQTRGGFMEARNLTFPGGLIVGAGLMYLFDPERPKGKIAQTIWGPGLQCIAGALGIAAVAYGAS